ncbi:MAG: HugZ family protein [Porticoccaceae bacterium]|uniref:HugZ family pyridoxamine 5'-phosphate oxidase n=1 Tax=Thalassospira sp. TaxID=1912094 RepID=UPI003A83D313
MSDDLEAPNCAALRRMCRVATNAALATIATGHKQVEDGWPVTSMVVPGTDIDGSPILLISDLADHTRHIAADNRVSMLFGPSANGTSATIETDTARLSVFGRAVRNDDAALRACYLRSHPDAAQYADFADFGFYRVDVDAIYWVGGFGKQRRLPGSQFIEADCHPLVLGHDDIIGHMNTDHANAISHIVSNHSDYDPDAGWLMHSIDCDGMVLSSHDTDSPPIRIDFPKPIHNPGEAREILVKMCKKWRG